MTSPALALNGSIASQRISLKTDIVQQLSALVNCGTMHADEIFATAFLDLYLGDRLVYRTNNLDNIKLSDDVIVYDIGRGKYDHHQNDALKREDGITYCSFGLLWKEFGKKFLKQQKTRIYFGKFERKFKCFRRCRFTSANFN